MEKITLKFVLSVLLLFQIVQITASQVTTYFPELGKTALYQHSLELRNNLKVLSIAIKPGYEDLTALSYLRLAKGAKITSVYVTNGEAGESDLCFEYPHRFAARLREEANQAISIIDGEVYFLSFPDIISAKDSVKILSLWPRDKLFARLKELISNFKPDIILLARDLKFGGESPLLEFLKNELMNACFEISENNLQQIRLFYDDPAKKGIVLPIQDKYRVAAKSYKQIGEEAGLAYKSIQYQLTNYKKSVVSSYTLLLPKKLHAIKVIDKGLPIINSKLLRSLHSRINTLTDATIKGDRTISIGNNKSTGVLKLIVEITDSLDYLLITRGLINEYERSIVLDWKSGLDKLKNTLLGVTVNYSISETVLTERQLTYININNVSGLSNNGTTEIYFPAASEGWIINEDIQKKLSLTLDQNYRLVSPEKLEYNYPHAEYGISKHTIGNPFIFFVIHRAHSKENSFIHKTVLRLNYAPRFVTEILTPIVKVCSGEKLIFKLTNNSRDGVADKVVIQDPIVQSRPSQFRLNYKGAEHQDTLLLNWNIDIPENNYLISLNIDDTKIARFAARKFDFKVDTTKKVGIIKSLVNSPITEVLRRLNIKYLDISSVNIDENNFMFDVIIIDRGAMTSNDKIIRNKSELLRFVENGGHLLILSQDSKVWNKNPLVDDFQLKSVFNLDETIPIEIDSGHKINNIPNQIKIDDFDNWIYLNSYNRVTISSDLSVAVPLRSLNSPLLVSKFQGKGKITYVDLAFHHQWINIHPGSFRLLANLIAY